MMSRTFVLVACAAMFCSSIANAQSSPAASAAFGEEITITATGLPESVDEVPASVTVIEAEEIEQAQLRTLPEVLARGTAAVALQSGGEGGQTSLFVRGSESDHTLVLFDGVRLNSPYFGGWDSATMLPIGLDRIELLRGPASARYGGDAIGGVLQLIPARGSTGLETELLIESGDDDWGTLHGGLAWAGDRFDFSIDIAEVSGEGALANSDFETFQGLVDIGFMLRPGLRLGLLAQDSEADTGIPLDLGLPSLERRQRTEQRLLAIPLSWQISDRHHLRASVAQVERQLDFSDPADAFGFTWSSTEADSLEARLELHHELGDDWKIAWGGEHRRDEVSDDSVFGTNLDNVEQTTSGAWLQGSALFGRLRTDAGIRLDEHDDWGSEISPRFGARLELDRGFSLKAAWGEAFRAPSLGELYVPFSGNPSLQPEESRSAEIGVIHQHRRSRIELTAWSNDLEQLIDFDFATFAFSNVESADLQGVDLDWRWRWSDRLVETFRLAWLSSEDVDGLELLRRPEWSGSWSFALAMPRWTGELSLGYVGERADVDPVSFSRIEVEDHLTVDLAATWPVSEHLEILARIGNAADEDYQAIAGYPAPGRRGVLGLRLRN